MELKIKEVLKSKGMKVSSLAESVGITRANMSNIVNGKSMPSLETLEKIASALELDITALFEQPQKRKLTINCPHCGEEISLSVKE